MYAFGNQSLNLFWNFWPAFPRFESHDVIGIGRLRVLIGLLRQPSHYGILSVVVRRHRITVHFQVLERHFQNGEQPPSFGRRFLRVCIAEMLHELVNEIIVEQAVFFRLEKWPKLLYCESCNDPKVWVMILPVNRPKLLYGPRDLQLPRTTNLNWIQYPNNGYISVYLKWINVRSDYAVRMFKNKW